MSYKALYRLGCTFGLSMCMLVPVSLPVVATSLTPIVTKKPTPKPIHVKQTIDDLTNTEVEALFKLLDYDATVTATHIAPIKTLLKKTKSISTDGLKLHIVRDKQKNIQAIYVLTKKYPYITNKIKLGINAKTKSSILFSVGPYRYDLTFDTTDYYRSLNITDDTVQHIIN
jgi:hypothetical protein